VADDIEVLGIDFAGATECMEVGCRLGEQMSTSPAGGPAMAGQVGRDDEATGCGQGMDQKERVPDGAAPGPAAEPITSGSQRLDPWRRWIRQGGRDVRR
jgi:hypothetical protein